MSVFDDAAGEMVALLSEAISAQLPDAAERRNHALLQAAATIEPFAQTPEEAVRRAANLLAEIERREKLEAPQ